MAEHTCHAHPASAPLLCYLTCTAAVHLDTGRPQENTLEGVGHGCHHVSTAYASACHVSMLLHGESKYLPTWQLLAPTRPLRKVPTTRVIPSCRRCRPGEQYISEHSCVSLHHWIIGASQGLHVVKAGVHIPRVKHLLDTFPLSQSRLPDP